MSDFKPRWPLWRHKKAERELFLQALRARHRDRGGLSSCVSVEAAEKKPDGEEKGE